MYVEHPYKFNDKFYAKVDGKFYEITREVAKAMLSAYRNEVYRSKKWQPEDPETMTRKTKWTELLDCVFSENTDGIGVQNLPDEGQRSVEDLVILQAESAELHQNIAKLSEHEQFIIKSIYFEGMKQVFDGGEIIAGAEVAAKPKVSSEAAGKGVFADDLMKVEDIKNGYCTQFLINKNEGASAAKMRAFAESNGDSVVCIEDDDVINLHVHTADPGKILSEAIKYGYLTNFKIENMHEQFLARQKQGKSLEKQASAEKAPSQASEFIYAAVDPSRDYGFVAVAAGEGLKAVFTDLAADAVVSGGQTMNPSTEDILAAIQSVPAKTVFVLPNNKNIIMAAEQAQKLADRQVVVLPTRTVPMGITALLNFDPSVNAETNTINMMAAADKVSTGLITYAARDSEYDGKRIRKGEIMALENGKIVSTSTDITKATYRLARNMCKKDSSFVTIISGCDVSDEDAEKVTEIVKAKCPNHVEVSHIRGGQPVYYYMISVE